MVVRPKFDPSTPKVAMRSFTFNSVKFNVGDDFNKKSAKVSARQLRQMYHARRIKDKNGAVAVVKLPKLTEAQELANALEEQRLIDNKMISSKLAHTKASLLQAVSDKEAEEAYDAQEKADAAKKAANATDKKPVKKTAPKKAGKKQAAKKPTEAKAEAKKSWE